MLKQLVNLVKTKKILQKGAISLSSIAPLGAYAGSSGGDPFPSPPTTGGGDVVATAGGIMQEALKYGLIGGGGLLVIICVAIIVHRMREDSKERDHGNLVMTYVWCALGATFGFVLIGFGWTAASASISS